MMVKRFQNLMSHMHAKGKKHQKKASQFRNIKREMKSITGFCSESTAISKKQKNNNDVSGGAQLNPAGYFRILNPEPQQGTLSQPATSQASSNSIISFSSGDSVLKTEIL